MPQTGFLIIGKVLILVLVLSLFVMSSYSQQTGSSLTAEEIKKVYDEKRNQLESLRKTEISLLAVEEAVRKYGGNNMLYKQRLEKLKEIALVKRILQNEVASLMFLCEEKKCNSLQAKEKEVKTTPAITPQVLAPQAVPPQSFITPQSVPSQRVPSVPSISVATMTVGTIPLEGSQYERRSYPPIHSQEMVNENQMGVKTQKDSFEEIEQLFKATTNPFNTLSKFSPFPEQTVTEKPEPSVPGFGSGKKKGDVVWSFEDYQIVKKKPVTISSAKKVPSTNVNKINMKKQLKVETNQGKKLQKNTKKNVKEQKFSPKTASKNVTEKTKQSKTKPSKISHGKTGAVSVKTNNTLSKSSINKAIKPAKK